MRAQACGTIGFGDIIHTRTQHTHASLSHLFLGCLHNAVLMTIYVFVCMCIRLWATTSDNLVG